MITSAQPNACRRQVVIVDACVDDYARLVEVAKTQKVRLTLTTTGAGALRLASSFSDSLWLVSTNLPDMSGLSLLEMLRSLLPKLTVCVVDRAHDEENERQALRLSADQYLCKPVQFAWIEAWRGPPGTSTSREIESPNLSTQVGRRF